MAVENEPLSIQGRVLDPPTLKYHPVSKQPTAVRDLFIYFSLRNDSSEAFIPDTTRRFMEFVRFPTVACFATR
jgi:hypothetical protein